MKGFYVSFAFITFSSNCTNPFLSRLTAEREFVFNYRHVIWHVADMEDSPKLRDFIIVIVIALLLVMVSWTAYYKFHVH